MKKIRTGNDIHIIWTITKNDQVTTSDEPLDLTGAEVLLIDNFNHPAVFGYQINTIDDNTSQVVGTFYGKDQATHGKYRLLLVKNRGLENMITLDFADAFILTCVAKFGVMEGNDEGSVTTAVVDLESSFNSYNGSPDMMQYYTKEEIDDLFAQYYTKTEVDELLNLKADKTALQAHTSNSNIHVTAAQKNLWNTVRDKANEDEVYALRQYMSVFEREITDEVATKANASDVYTKTQTDTLLEAKADESDLTAHTSDTTIHVTQADKDNWDSKQDNLPFKRGTGAHSVTQATTTQLYNDNIIADGSNSFIWSRGCYGTANYQFNVGGVMGSMYITNVDSNYVNYTLRMVTTTPTFESIETFSSIYYYVGYLRNSFVNLKLYSSSTQKYLGKINSIVSFNEATPYEFVISIDKTGAEESLTTASNMAIVAATNVNNGSYSNLISQYSKMNGQYSSVLGCGNYLEGAFANLFGIGLTAVGRSNNVFGSHNLSLPFTGSTNARNNIFGILNRINKTSGKNVFGFQNTINPYYGESSNATYFDTIVGNNNTIATRGIFVGETMNCPIKNSDQLRFMFGGFLNDNENGKKYKTIIGQYNATSNADATFVIATGNNNNRHNSIEVTNTNNTFTTHIKDDVVIDGTATFNDTVSIGQIANVETTINNKQNALTNYVENTTDPITRGYIHGSITKTVGTLTGGVGIMGSNSSDVSQLGSMVADLSNGKSFTNVIDTQNNQVMLGVVTDLFTSPKRNILDVSSNGVSVTTATGKTFTYNGNEVATVNQVETQCLDELYHQTTSNIVVDGVTYYYDPDLIVSRGQKLKANATLSGTYVALADINNGTLTIIQETLGQLLEVELDAVSDVTVLVYNGSTLNDTYYGIKVWDTVESLSAKSDKTVTSSTSNLKIEVVSAMPQTPDANTIYIVV